MWDAVTFVDWIWCCGTVLWPFLHAELRCDKVMDTFSGCGLCLPNLTQLPLHHLRDHRPPICVEIKVNSTFSLTQSLPSWLCCCLFQGKISFLKMTDVILYTHLENNHISRQLCTQVCQKPRLESVGFSVACLIASGHWTCWQSLMGFSISSYR